MKTALPSCLYSWSLEMKQNIRECDAEMVPLHGIQALGKQVTEAVLSAVCCWIQGTTFISGLQN